MHRFIVKPSDIKNHSVRLDPKESHHALKVLRLQVGDAVQVLDGKGASHSGFIADAAEGRVHISLDPNASVTQNRGVRLTLAIAMIKADRMEWLIEKACELGVFEIQPLMTERCVVRLDAEERAAKQKRWQKIAEASCKQCGLSGIPTILPPLKWKEFLAESGKTPVRLIASLVEGAIPLKTALTGMALPGSVVIAVGPEGDFTHTEIEGALSAAFKPVNLGSLVLRSETAAIYALSALNYQFGH